MCNVLLQKFFLFSIVAFKTLDILQDSVATHLRCGGIFSDSIVTNFLLILTVPFLGHPVFVNEYFQAYSSWYSNLHRRGNFILSMQPRFSIRKKWMLD